MKTSDFRFELPAALIAQYPLADRGASRLLYLEGDSGACEDRRFAELPALLSAGDLLVFNDTRVIPARLYGRKDSGGRVEVLVERLLGNGRVLAHVRASKTPAAGRRLLIADGISAVVCERQDDLFILEFETGTPVLEILEAHGHVPLPPYIDRDDEQLDGERYQTVYARHHGAVAAPTAGLHFDAAMLAELQAMDIHQAFVTLHVGAGTFQPVRAGELEQHRMHSETMQVSRQTCDMINAARLEGRRVIAVGTTVIRTLETAARQQGEDDGMIAPCSGETDIFIYPGFRFRVVDALLTNFHLPESTLLMLVCAFGGYEHVMRAYRHAVEAGYRFFSYGDAMFLTRRQLIDNKG